jgi:replicative DNA helicase
MGKQEYREQVAYASKQLKQLARVLNIPVVVAAQLRRDAEGKRPMLSDFSDSTQIERDADVAIMIHNIYNNGNLEDTWLLIEKNRDGRTGDVPVVFDQAFMRFRDK